MHPYFIEQQAQAHWEALHRVAAASRPADRPVRVRLGASLIALGERLAAGRAGHATDGVVMAPRVRHEAGSCISAA